MARKRLDKDFLATVDGLSHDGRGVARKDGKAVFITGALVGETVRAKQVAHGRHYDEAVTLEVMEASADRVIPKCVHYEQCSGCVLQHLEPTQQIVAKHSVLKESFTRIGQVEPKEYFEPIRMGNWQYRRKGRFSVRWVEKKDRAVVGFRETNPKFVADLQYCETVVPQVAAQIAPLAQMVSQLEAKRSIPQIEFICGDAGVAFVVRHLQDLSVIDLQLLRDYEAQSGSQIYLQSGGTDSVRPLSPPASQLYFDLSAHGIRLNFEPLDFIQVNAALNEQMISRAIELLAPGKQDRILDLFCGLGNFTLPLAKHSDHVVGVEGDAGLIARARANAQLNKLNQVQFFCADLAKDLRGEPWMAQGINKLLLDPPRAGAAEVLAQFPLKQIEKIVYVSCHPASLARDAGFLVRERGFKLVGAGVMDMFPHTAHVESIAVFER